MNPAVQNNEDLNMDKEGICEVIRDGIPLVETFMNNDFIRTNNSQGTFLKRIII